MSNNKQLPSKAARVIAALCALVLTASLTITLCSTIGIQVLTSSELHEKTALASDAIDRQMNEIRSNLSALGEEYSFDPQDLISLVPQNQVEQLDREIIRWWTGTMKSGTLGEKPSFNLQGGKEALLADQGFMAGLEEVVVNLTIEKILIQANRIVMDSSVQFRDVLIEAGFRMAGQKVDLPELISLMKKVPTLGGLGALLAAGLIALLMSRRILTAGEYIGGAVSASGLLCLTALLMFRQINIRGMVAEASEALSMQVSHLSGILTTQMLIGTAALFLVGGVLMILARREYIRYGK